MWTLLSHDLPRRLWKRTKEKGAYLRRLLLDQLGSLWLVPGILAALLRSDGHCLCTDMIREQGTLVLSVTGQISGASPHSRFFKRKHSQRCCPMMLDDRPQAKHLARCAYTHITTLPASVAACVLLQLPVPLQSVLETSSRKSRSTCFELRQSS